jgi:carbon monoxide dehydrogenase subunit G
MDLHDEFGVTLPVAEAWAVLTDVEKIAPCLPGIWLREVEGDEYQGVVKVKVGPVTASYEGVARFLLLDADAHKAVLKAEGREIRGQAKGTALVTATLSPSAEGTRVQVVTVLSVGGRLAQFAKGVIAAVSRNLIAEFAENLELTVPAAPNATTAEPVVGTETAEGADKAPAGASPRR